MTELFKVGRNSTDKVTSGFLMNIRRYINELLEFLCKNFKGVYDRNGGQGC